MSDRSYCARHGDTETNLRCSRCETLICPRCLVHSPVGMRCPECAGETKLPTFDVPWPVLATAIGVGLALSIAGGVVLGLLSRFFSLGLIESFLVLGMGYLIGEGISVVVNRKRGRSLKYVAAGGVLVSFAILLVAGTGQMNLFDILALAVAVYVATSRF